MSVAGKIAKNTTYLFISALFQKILAFGFFIYIAAQLGEELLGRYTFALGFAGIFVIIMNFGLVPVLTREGAKDKESIQKQFEFMLAFKIALAVVTLVGMFAVFHFMNLFKDVPLYTIQLVYLSAIVILFDTFRSIFLAVLRAVQKMKYEAIGQLLYQIIIVGVGTLVLMNGMKAKALVLVIALASFVYFAYSWYVIVRKTDIRPRLHWMPGQVKTLMKVALPFALADIFFKLNGSIDTVMLEYLAGDRFVSWYNIALKLTVTLTIIPGAFATAFFPAMSRAFKESRETLRDIFERSVEFLLILGTPISIGAAVLAPNIINLAFPDFPASIIALQLFMSALIFLFVNYPVGNLLNASNRQKTNTMNMSIALLCNIILNIFLIPRYTYVGAAITSVISTILLVGLGLPHVYKVVQFRTKPLIVRFSKAVLAASVMGVVLWWLSDLGLLWLICIGVVVYTIVLVMIRGISLSESKQVYQSLIKREML